MSHESGQKRKLDIGGARCISARGPAAGMAPDNPPLCTGSSRGPLEVSIGFQNLQTQMWQRSEPESHARIA